MERNWFQRPRLVKARSRSSASESWEAIATSELEAILSMLSRDDILAILAFGDMEEALNKKGKAIKKGKSWSIFLSTCYYLVSYILDYRKQKAGALLYLLCASFPAKSLTIENRRQQLLKYLLLKYLPSKSILSFWRTKAFWCKLIHLFQHGQLFSQCSSSGGCRTIDKLIVSTHHWYY